MLQKDKTIKKYIQKKCDSFETVKPYKNYNSFTKKKNRKKAIDYIAKLNVPLLPKKKQVVLGTTKYLLPYFCLPNYFNIFAVDPDDWTMDKNNKLIHTIIALNEPIIRVVTKPSELINEGTLRVTSKELCILFHDYEIYKLKDETIYFLIKKGNKIKLKNNNLIVVDNDVILHL
jgi:hypothetical protein